MAASDSQESYKRRVREANDIVEVVQAYGVTLKRSGRNWMGLCPFHQEKTSSFSVNQEGQFYHCFGCGKGGDVFSFVMEADRVDFREAIETLGRRANIPPPQRDEGEEDKYRKWTEWKEYIFRLNSAARSYYEAQLREDRGLGAREYLHGRKISEDSWKRFGLGFSPPDGSGLVEHLRSKGAPDKAIERAGLASRREDGSLYDYFRGRVMFPIADVQGRVLGFGARVLGDGEPKYLNTRESPVFSKGKVIYGMFQARAAVSATRVAILVEGYTDVIMCHQFGIENVVAIMGTAVTPDHLRLLRRYADQVVLLTDMDAAGRRASLRSLPVLLSEDVRATVAALPGGEKDPCDFLLAEGADAFKKALSGARDLFDFKFEAAIAEKDLANAQVLGEVVRDLMETVSYAKDPLQRSILRRQVAERLRLKEEDLKFVPVRDAKAPAGGDGRSGAPEEAPSVRRSVEPLDTLAAAERDLLKLLLQRPRWIEHAATRLDLTALSNPLLRDIGTRLLTAYADGRLGEGPAEAIVRELDDPDAQQAAIRMIEEPIVRTRTTEEEYFASCVYGVLLATVEARIKALSRKATAAKLAGNAPEAGSIEQDLAALQADRQRLKGLKSPRIRDL